MEQFANRSDADRQAFFEIASDKKNLSEEIIEKDFWVCWTLKQLFALPDISDNLIFKGGTSLSKAYNLIERFSEDIDISIDKNYLKFSDEQDPEKARSSKKQQLLIKELSNACRNFVNKELKVKLESVFSNSLNRSKTTWQIGLDPDDVDGQSLLFHYPTLNSNQNNVYIRRAVKIEFGAHGGSEPTCISTIIPFIEEAIPNTLSEPKIQIKTLKAERTFWEKATILHMYSNWPENKIIPE